jgi:hypothetical protein
LTLRRILFAAYVPPCIATCANPGSGFSFGVEGSGKITDDVNVLVIRDCEVRLSL